MECYIKNRRWVQFISPPPQKKISSTLTHYKISYPELRLIKIAYQKKI